MEDNNYETGTGVRSDGECGGSPRLYPRLSTFAGAGVGAGVVVGPSEELEAEIGRSQGSTSRQGIEVREHMATRERNIARERSNSREDLQASQINNLEQIAKPAQATQTVAPTINIAAHQAQDRPPSLHYSTTEHQAPSPSIATDVATVQGHWSHDANGGSSAADIGLELDVDVASSYVNTSRDSSSETYQYQLQLWVYETSDKNLTLTERLEKMK